MRVDQQAADLFTSGKDKGTGSREFAHGMARLYLGDCFE